MTFLSQDQIKHQPVKGGEKEVKQKHIVACYILELSEEINFSGPVWQQNITPANAYLEKSLHASLIQKAKQQPNCILNTRSHKNNCSS